MDNNNKRFRKETAFRARPPYRTPQLDGALLHARELHVKRPPLAQWGVLGGYDRRRHAQARPRRALRTMPALSSLFSRFSPSSP
jgi:hypothetical protein